MSKRGPKSRYVVTTVTADDGPRTVEFTSRALANRDYKAKRARLLDGTIELRMLPDNEVLRCHRGKL